MSALVLLKFYGIKYIYKNNSKSLFYIKIKLSSEIFFLLISPEKGQYLQIYSLEG